VDVWSREYGGLVDGCYNARKASGAQDELIWGDYFALEAALGLAGQPELTFTSA
jgi:hypothetical protein